MNTFLQTPTPVRDGGLFEPSAWPTHTPVEPFPEIQQSSASIDWGDIMPYLLGGAQIGTGMWAANRQANIDRAQAEREAYLNWQDRALNRQIAIGGAKTNAILAFANEVAKRRANDMQYTQYNPLFQQGKEARLQLARAFGGQMSPYRISPNMQTSGGAIIPEGGINLDALSQSNLDAAKADFAQRRELALNPPGWADREQQVMDTINKLESSQFEMDPPLYPFYDQMRAAQTQQPAQDGGGTPWWRRALATIGAAAMPLLGGVIPGASAFASFLSPALATWGHGGGVTDIAAAGAGGGLMNKFATGSFRNPQPTPAQIAASLGVDREYSRTTPSIHDITGW